ncbi:MAG: hypothetical protein ABIN37_04075 [Burkholderiaceae bacterium]
MTATVGRAFPRLAALYVVAILFNYGWELAQSGLFVPRENSGNVWWHCFVASLGDGFLIWVIHAVGWSAFRRQDWFERSGGAGYALTVVSGVLIAIAVEWVAVHVLHRWAYAATMPIVPGLRIGLVPVLQMLILPVATFQIVANWIRRRRIK